MNKVLLDFYADWCGPCKQQDPIVQEVKDHVSQLKQEGKAKNVKIKKVDIDEDPELAQVYGVT